MAKANIQERIITLMLETALSEMKTGQGDELDLTSYLEVQGRIKSALRAHKDTLEALRDVWKLAVRSRVGMHSIQKMFYRIHVRERFADTQYRLLLQRHPTNAHLLRAYGVWLQGVKANLAGGSKYMQEADRREIHVPQKKATQGENGVNSVNENEVKDGGGAGISRMEGLGIGMKCHDQELEAVCLGHIISRPSCG